jgi:hypothetical protein
MKHKQNPKSFGNTYCRAIRGLTECATPYKVRIFCCRLEIGRESQRSRCMRRTLEEKFIAKKCCIPDLDERETIRNTARGIASINRNTN